MAESQDYPAPVLDARDAKFIVRRAAEARTLWRETFAMRVAPAPGLRLHAGSAPR